MLYYIFVNLIKKKFNLPITILAQLNLPIKFFAPKKHRKNIYMTDISTKWFIFLH